MTIRLLKGFMQKGRHNFKPGDTVWGVDDEKGRELCAIGVAEELTIPKISHKRRPLQEVTKCL